RSCSLGVLCFSAAIKLFSQGEYEVPRVVTPAREVPSITIPGRIIPGKVTAIGKLPDIVFDEIVLPSIILDPIDTSKNYNSANDFIERNAPSTSVVYRPIIKALSLENRISQYTKDVSGVSSAVIELFTKFDTNQDGRISLLELEHFQNYIVKTYKYMSNNKALSPTQFIVAGGGDCEDFAILTAEFLEFWGEQCFVGGLFNARTGHAIALFRVNAVPFGLLSIVVRDDSPYYKKGVPSGQYLPIDYEYVGGYSSATEAGMKLKYVWSSREIIGEMM
ncbi:MAG: EF-hand domain-containing protein, partial [Spirochaetota bacterium]